MEPGAARSRFERRPAVNKKRLKSNDDARTRLLDVAEGMMSRRGYAGTSIAEIVDAAGVRAPTLYWYFENKQGMLTALMERGAATWYAGLPRLNSVAGTTSTERLVAAMSEAGRAVEANPQFLRLLILLSLERTESDVSVLAAIRDIRAQARGWLSTLFHDGWPALEAAQCEVLAGSAMAFADGWCVLHMVEPERSDAVGFTWTAETLAREADRLAAEAIRTH